MRRPQVCLPVLGLMAAILPGCEGALQIQDKQFLTPDNTSTEVLVAGAIHDFGLAYAGGGELSQLNRFVPATGLLADELYSSVTWTAWIRADQRAQEPINQGNMGDGAYFTLHRARQAAIRALRALDEDGAGASPQAAHLKTLEAFTYVALGEGFCSGIPFSEVAPDGTLTHGVPLSTAQVFEEAVERFDAALSIDGSCHAARVGKGRALTSLGRFAEAAAAVTSVPTSFVEALLFSDNSTEQNNPIWVLQSSGVIGMGITPEADDPIRARRDPRMLPGQAGPGFDPAVDAYSSLKYSQRSSSIVLADGVEARLIEAEGDLATGGQQWIAILNELRASAHDLMAERVLGYGAVLQEAIDAGTVDSGKLAPLTDPGTERARVELLFAERAAWLFVTGHRLGDMRRLLRPPYDALGFTADEVYPSGSYFGFGDYGDDVVLTIPFAEQNNLHWDTSLCSYTTP